MGEDDCVLPDTNINDENWVSLNLTILFHSFGSKPVVQLGPHPWLLYMSNVMKTSLHGFPPKNG